MSDADKPDDTKRNQPPQMPSKPSGIARPTGSRQGVMPPLRPGQVRPGMPNARPVPQPSKVASMPGNAKAPTAAQPAAAKPTAPTASQTNANTAASLGFGAQRLGNPNAVPRPGMGGTKKGVDNKPVDDTRLQANGFTTEESSLLRESLQLAGLRYFDGDGLVMGKKENTELSFKAGQSQNFRWIVMGFPMYNMNMPNAVEICLHFMAESYDMVHMLDFQYQVGINMETENLEFLIQLPLLDITASQLSELINVFFQTLNDSVMKEMDNILQMMRDNAEDE